MEFLSAILDNVSALFTPSFWKELLITYKYWVVILGALIEGEMVLLVAAGTAYHQYLDLSLVMLIAFIGAVIHDTLLFFVGRLFGEQIQRRASKKATGRLSKAITMIEKYNNLFIMSFRFIYGVRTITPIVIGTTHIKLPRYMAMISISAAIWAITISYLGYTCAMALEAVLENFDLYKKYLAIGLAIIIAGIYVVIKFRKRK